MIRTALVLGVAGLLGAAAWWAGSQQSRSSSSRAPRVQLVVLLVLDQFRGDYVERFADHFGDRGFNLLLRDGAHLRSVQYEYSNTDTCPGHATVSTGALPATTGIVANSWYDRKSRTVRSCSADPEESLVGARGPGESPRPLLTPTIGDLLKKANDGSTRVISIGGKDYAAIMLGGRRADAAYWTLDTLVVSSTYYMDDLPDWVRAFNSAGWFTRHFGTTWARVLPAAAYPGPDDVPAENGGLGLGRTFPRTVDGGLDSPGPAFFKALEATPFHDDILVEFAMEAIRREELGQRGHTDLLALALSAHDRVGHRFGPDSDEIVDAVVRSDRRLARLFAFVERAVGLDNTLIVLTSDHGVAPLPASEAATPEAEPGSAGGRIPGTALEDRVRTALNRARGVADGADWIAYHEYPYLNLSDSPGSGGAKWATDLERTAAAAVRGVPGVLDAYTWTELREAWDGPSEHWSRPTGGPIPSRVLLGFHPARSGDVYYELERRFLVDDAGTGTNHGTGWDYDTHVPLLWRGPGIRPGSLDVPATPADIVPTLASLLGLPPSAGWQGRSIDEIIGVPST